MTTDNLNKPKTLVCVVGARPNFMKMAPIIRELKKVNDLIIE